MRTLVIALATTSCLYAGTEPTPEELLVPRRIVEYGELFDRIDVYFSHRGVHPAEISELDDPTLHFSSTILREWSYYVQPIFECVRNVVIIGIDDKGEAVTYSTSATLVYGNSSLWDLIQLRNDELEKCMGALELIIHKATGQIVDPNRSTRTTTYYVGPHEFGVIRVQEFGSPIEMHELNSIDPESVSISEQATPELSEENDTNQTVEVTPDGAPHL